MARGGGFGSSLILNSLVVYPGTKYLLTNEKRFPNPAHRKLLALLFLAIIGIAGISMELHEIFDDRNLFKIMRVPRTAVDSDIRSSYLKLSRELHPDVNKNSPTAEQDFNEMKDAYQILINPKTRQTYDRWGYSGLDWGSDPMSILYSGLLNVGVSYVMWLALSVLLTASSSNTHARSISIAGLCLVIAMDLHMRTTSEFSFVMPYFAHVAVYQLSQLLFTLYPTFIGGVIVFQNVTYVDATDRNWKLLSHLYHRQTQFEETLKNLEDTLRLTGRTGGLSGIATSAKLPASSGSDSSLPRHQQAKNAAATTETHAPPKRPEIPSWLFVLGFYVLFNYILK